MYQKRNIVFIVDLGFDSKDSLTKVSFGIKFVVGVDVGFGNNLLLWVLILIDEVLWLWE